MKRVNNRFDLGFACLLTASLTLGCGGDDDGGGPAAAAGAGGGSGAAGAGGSGEAGGGGGGGMASGGGTAEPCTPDESAPVPTRDAPGDWQRVELEGAICSNGTPFPIFVNYSETSNNLVVMLEPGGACWDYASCSPEGGLRGAANPNGISAGIDHMARFQFLPLMRREAEVNPISDWNMVFIPYCTGDIHTGDNTITYEGPAGEQLEFHHNGHNNVMAAIEWMDQTFTDVPRLLVTGCSAGGAGAIINYHFFRQGITGAQCGYLLNDSGPIFPSDGNSAPLHAKVRESWNVDPIIDSLEGEFPGITKEDIKADFGTINEALSLVYPSDRLSITVYRRDLNYSLYSYESFYGMPEYTEVHGLWEEDLALLKEQYDLRSNLGYFIPFFRIDNCSHCVSIPPIGLDGSDLVKALESPWLGSEIEEANMNLRDYVIHLLDDGQPIESHFESEQADEGFTPEEAAVCQGL